MTIVADMAGAIVVLAAIGLVVALGAFGWKDLAWVLITRGPTGAASALAITVLIVLVSLPPAFLASFLAAACVAEPSIGGSAGKTLSRSLGWSSGIPPVAIGMTVLYAAVALRLQDAILAATAALVLLNFPRTTARLAQAFATVPQELKETAAALGASAVTSFFALVQPSSGWAILAALFALAGAMIGETTAMALAMGARPGGEPLSVQIWHFASNMSLARTEAASSIVLVLAVAACMALARACACRHAEAVAQPS